MEALYSTQKEPGQTLQQFEADVKANPAKWIAILRKRQALQDSTFSDVRASLGTIGKAIRKADSTLTSLLGKQHSLEYKAALQILLDGLKCQQTSFSPLKEMVLPNVDYDTHISMLCAIRRQNLGVVRDPCVVGLTTIVTTPGIVPNRGLFPGSFVPMPPPHGISLAQYKNDLLTLYPTYLLHLGKEKNKIISLEKFTVHLEETLSQLQDGDIYVEFVSFDKCFFVHLRDGELYLAPVVSQCDYDCEEENRYWLPKECYPTLKRFGVTNYQDLNDLYGEHDNMFLRGVITPDGKSRDLAEDEDTNISTILLGNHPMRFKYVHFEEEVLAQYKKN